MQTIWKMILIAFAPLMLLSLFKPGITFAKIDYIGCSDRYLTLVNPVRGRERWRDKSIAPLINQYSAVKKYNFSATWLLQYDAIQDDRLIEYVKDNFSDDQELGIFLEVSPDLAKDSRIIYPHAVAWDDPNAVFLSGYSQSERRKLINGVFSKFKNTFGYYPKSVGAWWIDSYSLNYMIDKFGVKSALIVADQRTTDDYGVWGQWWGYPYHSSKANILVPAKNKNEKQDLVIIQWAQRDLTKAYGKGLEYSNYSLQANDYLERGLNTNYFSNLISQYLDCSLDLGQITVGLETGMESVGFDREYENQLRVLKSTEGLKDLTMSEFSDAFTQKYKINPQEVILKGEKSKWILSPDRRINRELGDSITYQNNLAFSDYFIADRAKFLNRRLPIEHQEVKTIFFPFLWLLPLIIGLITAMKMKLSKYTVPIYGFILISFLSFLRSHVEYGWKVFYGPVVNNIYLAQFLLISVYILIFFYLVKIIKNKMKGAYLFFWLLPLSYFVDFIVQRARYTQIEGIRYFGFAWDALHFIGFSQVGNQLSFVNRDFPPVISGSMLRFDFEKIWSSPFLSFVVYPLLHVLFSFLLFYLIIKLPKRYRKLVIILISVPFLFFVYSLMTMDPRIVL